MKTLLALLLLASPALAAKTVDPDMAPAFDVECKLASSTFSLHFQSKSGEVSEDDMTVTLRQEGKELTLPLKPGWYKLSGSVRDVSKLPRVCRAAKTKSYDFDYPAFEISPSQVLLFFRIDGRPGFSHASALLYDTKARKVLDVQEEIASLKDKNMVFRATKGGVEQRLIRDWIDHTGCDCAESAIEDWNSITVRGGKIQLGWSSKKF